MQTTTVPSTRRSSKRCAVGAVPQVAVAPVSIVRVVIVPKVTRTDLADPQETVMGLIVGQVIVVQVVAAWVDLVVLAEPVLVARDLVARPARNS